LSAHNYADRSVLTGWTQNVIDKYKGLSTHLIREDLQKNAHQFAVMMEHWRGDFNIGTMIRNANAFNAKEVFYYGKKKYDRRGAVGTQHYVNLRYLSSPDVLVSLKSDYIFVCLDNNIEGAVPMEDFIWPENSLMIFGEEGPGITKSTLDLADHVISIKQYGSVRSLNVGTASGIAMYDYLNKLNSI
jgi:tRNA G18 (ribose-2'-O)-methylase SpoU